MGITAWLIAYGAVLAACVLALCVLAAVVLGAPSRRRTRERQAVLDAELSRSRVEVEALRSRVEQLGREVVEARHAAEVVDREYVITSLGERALDNALDHTVSRVPGETGELGHLRRTPVRAFLRPGVGEVLETRLVRTLTQVRDGSPVTARAADLVVRTVAVGHGVRRALSPDVLDRAAAEAGVARRRSRRERRRELREARRLVRAVRMPGDRGGGSIGRATGGVTGRATGRGTGGVTEQGAEDSTGGRDEDAA